MQTRTALLVFYRSAEQEAQYKTLVNNRSRKQNHRALGALNRHTYKVAQSSGLPVFYFDEARQVGNSFGSRFTNAFQQLFDEGYEQVIAIGNDHPGLSAHHVQAAQFQLSNHDQVLGPAKDGGFYLMGLRKEAFQALPFRELPWQTNRLASAYQKALKPLGHSVWYLSPLQDLDEVADLKFLRPSLACRQLVLVRWLKSLLAHPLQVHLILKILLATAGALDAKNSRGPPPCFA